MKIRRLKSPDWPWPDLTQMTPLRFKEYSYNTGTIGSLIGFGGLVVMGEYLDMPVRFLIAFSFLLLAGLLTSAIREAAYWLATHQRQTG
jgi:hypothetical protein